MACPPGLTVMILAGFHVIGAIVTDWNVRRENWLESQWMNASGTSSAKVNFFPCAQHCSAKIGGAFCCWERRNRRLGRL